MDRLNHVLIATDFSDASECAIDHAAIIAAKNDATLHIAHVNVVHHDLYGDEPFPERSRYQEALAKSASEGLQAVEPKFSCPIERVSLRGVSAAASIVEYVEEAGIDLVVVGTHGRTGLSHVLLGSVAQEVVRSSPVSVLVVSKDHSLKASTYKTIVCAVDLSEPSRKAMREAVALCKSHRARLILMHVAVPTNHFSPYIGGSTNLLEMFPDLEKRARDELEDWLSQSGLPREQCQALVMEGKVHQRIDEVAKNHDADVVVVGTSGLGGVERFLLGSVAEKVVRTSPSPVLVVRSLVNV